LEKRKGGGRFRKPDLDKARGRGVASIVWCAQMELSRVSRRLGHGPKRLENRFIASNVRGKGEVMKLDKEETIVPAGTNHEKLGETDLERTATFWASKKGTKGESSTRDYKTRTEKVKAPGYPADAHRSKKGKYSPRAFREGGDHELAEKIAKDGKVLLVRSS